ncbi:citrate/2-methylcitrate synthase [Lachnospira multipara]|uniref:citrate/2-methylcitrate synthase n=1 Tax=Lachnospira multipara TaxID=28051 RepID=UPI0004891172|nr:citrate/2-methylcitrate synthase [Lachnospira multipara]
MEVTEKNFSQITQDIKDLATKARNNNKIQEPLYEKYQVKRGLRDLNGKGVLTGLTEISEIVASYTDKDGVSHPCDGKLYYRGIDVENLIAGITSEKRFGFEEATYLLMFGELPNQKQLERFTAMLGDYRQIPPNFVRDIIMKKPSKDIMNALARSVLMLYSYDSRADDVSIPNVVRQSMQLISEFPLLAVYSYQAYKQSTFGGSLIIHEPRPDLSTAENILHLLRPDSEYTKLEAQLLDVALVLHAEHGGGNNSTFTTHVVTSSGTDTYSAVVSSLGSLKGPRHGGANIKVVKMFEDIKEHVKNWEDEDELTSYLDEILHKKAFDKTGLIYGMGHAVYSLSDPRARAFKGYVEKLSKQKGKEDEYRLMTNVERIAAELIAKERKIYKGVSANVDFYSGFAYKMLGLPMELYTPIFAIARISGWSAHRIEELINCGKIIRPAYMNVQDRREYIPLKDR